MRRTGAIRASRVRSGQPQFFGRESWLSRIARPLVLIGSWPTWYRRWPRAVRDALRVGLGLLAAVGSFGVASAPGVAWPALTIAAALWWVYRRRRVQVNARRCDGCPELGRGVCSGYAAHAAAMRAIAGELEGRMNEGTYASPMRSDSNRPETPPRRQIGRR